ALTERGGQRRPIGLFGLPSADDSGCHDGSSCVGQGPATDGLDSVSALSVRAGGRQIQPEIAAWEAGFRVPSFSRPVFMRVGERCSAFPFIPERIDSIIFLPPDPVKWNQAEKSDGVPPACLGSRWPSGSMRCPPWRR